MAVAAVMAGVLLYHVAMARPAFYNYGFRPYPPLPHDVSALLHAGDATGPQRLASWAPRRSTAAGYAFTLPHNLPAVYRLPAFCGYDPLVECTPAFQEAEQSMRRDPAAAAKVYGIRWWLADRTRNHPARSPNPNIVEMETTVRLDAAFRQIDFSRTYAPKNLPDLAVLELDGVDPLAFVDGRPERALPLRLHGEGIDVDVSGLRSPGRVVVNFLWYPEMKAAADGKELSCLRDRWGRIVADVPAGAKTLAIRFRPDWLRGTLWGGASAALALAAAAVLARRGKP
jgi:hypothetical protein